MQQKRFQSLHVLSEVTGNAVAVVELVVVVDKLLLRLSMLLLLRPRERVLLQHKKEMRKT
jgi:hypothetical protein